jgi:hypothetical protein
MAMPNVKQALAVTALTAAAVAYLTMRGRPDVAAAFVSVATAKVLGQAPREDDVRAVKAFAQQEGGFIAAEARKLFAQHAAGAGQKVRDWMKR